MGYDLHITRADSWAENDGKWIAPEELLHIVDRDATLQLAPQNGPHFTIWNGLSVHSEPWLDWLNGNVMTKNPDTPLIDKMIELAQILDAKVQGDDGEVYDKNGQISD